MIPDDQQTVTLDLRCVYARLSRASVSNLVPQLRWSWILLRPFLPSSVLVDVDEVPGPMPTALPRAVLTPESTKPRYPKGLPWRMLKRQVRTTAIDVESIRR